MYFFSPLHLLGAALTPHTNIYLATSRVAMQQRRKKETPNWYMHTTPLITALQNLLRKWYLYTHTHTERERGKIKHCETFWWLNTKTIFKEEVNIYFRRPQQSLKRMICESFRTESLKWFKSKEQFIHKSGVAISLRNFHFVPFQMSRFIDNKKRSLKTDKSCTFQRSDNLQSCI